MGNSSQPIVVREVKTSYSSERVHTASTYASREDLGSNLATLEQKHMASNITTFGTLDNKQSSYSVRKRRPGIH